MPSISLQLDNDLYKTLSKVCSELGLQKRALMLRIIKMFVEELEDTEDKKLLKIAEKRLKQYEAGKLKTVKLREAWK